MSRDKCRMGQNGEVFDMLAHSINKIGHRIYQQQFHSTLLRGACLTRFNMQLKITQNDRSTECHMTREPRWRSQGSSPHTSGAASGRSKKRNLKLIQCRRQRQGNLEGLSDGCRCGACRVHSNPGLRQKESSLHTDVFQKTTWESVWSLPMLSGNARNSGDYLVQSE